MRRGTGILFYDRQNRRVLLFRRDDKPKIPYPGQLDILGGKVELGEEPKKTIVREMDEELFDHRTGKRFELKDFWLFKVWTDPRGTEQHIFAKEADFQIKDLRLDEGQKLVWLTEQELDSGIELAYGYSLVAKEFFQAHLQ
jgi:hypothetical protein